MKKTTLAQSMAEELREAILAGAWAPGESLPTEPELAQRFDVSRAVVRDATRIVAAWGLVEPRQGKGVFVAVDDGRGLSDALLLALRRAGASAWDVEQVEWLLYPEAAALVASRGKEVDFDELRRLLEAYGRELVSQSGDCAGSQGFAPHVRRALDAFIEAVYRATGNRLLAYLGPAIARIRQPRRFRDTPEVHPVEEHHEEVALIGSLVDAMESGDPELARNRTRAAFALPEPAVEGLRQTPVGEVPEIPLTLADLRSYAGSEDS